MASKTGTLYIGMTNNLYRRISEHKSGKNGGFAARYSCTKLVYYEVYSRPLEAIVREKCLKGWIRKKKENIIATLNPAWKDLSEGL